MGRQIKQNVFLFVCFFKKNSLAPKMNTVGKYVLIKDEI